MSDEDLPSRVKALEDDKTEESLVLVELCKTVLTAFDQVKDKLDILKDQLGRLSQQITELKQEVRLQQ